MLSPNSKFKIQVFHNPIRDSIWVEFYYSVIQLFSYYSSCNYLTFINFSTSKL